MEDLLSTVDIKVNEKLFLKNPTSSELGMRIVNFGISMIQEVGFENFTFKKLAARIETTEASIYRYFECKHSFLLYLINWYWGMIEYRLLIETANIDDPIRKLYKSLHVITSVPNPENELVFQRELSLKSLVINESAKIYRTKAVDKENEDGAYSVYKSIVARIVELIVAINPNYPYPAMLISTIIESSNHQRFFKDHLPKLTNTVSNKDAFEHFALDLINKTLEINGKR
ncbi:MAG: TetR/AcrR family transcriptional regulator [Flavobacteriales bacterium]|nr:TetR/AcrR family transcriptional regulator [Flavobacteriales bacterium]